MGEKNAADRDTKPTPKKDNAGRRARLTLDEGQTADVHAGGFFSDMVDWMMAKAGYQRE
jgi:hypothetical protein